MLFMYVGPNPNGLADYYGYRFKVGQSTEVDNPIIAEKCGRNPNFERVIDVDLVPDSTVVEIEAEAGEEPAYSGKKRGRPRKVVEEMIDGDASGTEE